MNNQHKIISLDLTRTWCEELNHVLVFKKITQKAEVNLLQFASKALDGRQISIDGHCYTLHVPKVYDWNEQSSVVTMSYCEGENLECLLCTPTTRNFAIKILQELLKFVIFNKFFWYDFAPRNILINSDSIFFVDFEKGIDNNVEHLKLFLRNHVFEEYSSFLMKNERIYSSEYVYTLYDGERDVSINISDVKVKRFKAVALQLGYTDTIKLSELLGVQHLIINAEEPRIIDHELIFPRIKLVKMLEDKLRNPQVYIEYAKLIVEKSEV